MTDFRECVIIPLAMFESCNFRDPKQTDTTEQVLLGKTPKQPNTTGQILFDKSLPSDMKMKLYYQQNKLSSATREPTVEMVKRPVETSPRLASDVDSIVREFSSIKVPVVSRILSLILQNQDILRWNDKLEVVINGIHQPGTNIIDLLRYVTGVQKVTSDKGLPPAATQFYESLKQIGLPHSSMIKPKIPKTSPQVGEGWIHF